MDNTFQAFDKEARIYKRHRKLPHWEQPGCTYFVTYRLADSLPRKQLDLLAQERQQWFKEHPRPWNELEYEQYQLKFTGRVEKWLDNAHGSCVLRQPSIAEEVVESLHHFDEERYILDEYAIMPNHVHVLVKPHKDHRLKTILSSWRSYSALQINRVLERSGQLWMDEPFDHIVRSWKHMCQFRRYIQSNPSKADLCEGDYILGSGRGIVLE